MQRSVIYLMTGKAHVPYLLVCLRTLRDNYDGDVVIYCTEDETAKLCYPLGQCFDADVRRTEAMKLRKNVQFTTKVRLFADGRELPDGIVAYLDADLIIRKPIDAMLDGAALHGSCFTQFCDWVTNCGIIEKRIRRFYDFDVDHVRIDGALSNANPSPNGGVFAINHESCRELCREWLDWTVKGNSSFIADETALNILFPRWSLYGESSIICGGQFNCSPKHKPETLSWEDVHVLHGHGDSFARPEKKGVEHWWPLFVDCWRKNLGGCRDWSEWHCGNKHLRQLPQAAALVEFA